MAAVADALLLVQPGGQLHRQAGLAPDFDPACEGGDVVAELRQPPGGERGTVPVRAVEDDRASALDRGGLQPAHRDVDGARNPAGLPLAGLAHVDQERRLLCAEQLVRPSRVDLVENLAVSGHAARIIGPG